MTWLDPVTAAYLGVVTEIACPILLTLGLATRLAAIPLLLLSLVRSRPFDSSQAQ